MKKTIKKKFLIFGTIAILIVAFFVYVGREKPAEFDFEIVYVIEDDKWREDIRNLLSAMKMLEDSYLGGSGSRGYGKVGFEFDGIIYKDRDYYTGGKEEVNLIDKKLSVKDVLKGFDSIFGKITI